ncbi:DUF3077 domain-containing protein [Pseudomonas sp. 6D_7.1_Bac1]|jgi:hypothetical protein|uniref:DUF3077 domain-containing protein n=1 Tax=Pseudomonas sp. 6D_7.1_Bac1 TaxID=2971615 RepID=UPI0021C98209|nr:DUF3077 domain-containing protein [Pseudomonas sp. 6D_7.1_Bac1]MCU1750577.1 DUF3077 domain-containing protein [Pseudomonas sp. 6D_7.1_Bac1]
MTDHSDIKTIGIAPFGYCGDSDQPLFRVNRGVQIREALERASDMLHCAKVLAMDAAMERDKHSYAWASHYLIEMSKAVVDDVVKVVTPMSGKRDR